MENIAAGPVCARFPGPRVSRPLSESLAPVYIASGCRESGPRGLRARKTESQVPGEPSATALAPRAPLREPLLRVSWREISEALLAHQGTRATRPCAPPRPCSAPGPSWLPSLSPDFPTGYVPEGGRMECTRQPCERESGDGPVAGGLHSLTSPSIARKCSLPLMDGGW